MKIAFLTPKNPETVMQKSGGIVKSALVLDILNEIGSVDVLSLDLLNAQKLPKKPSFMTILLSFIWGVPSSLYRNYDSILKREFNERLRSFDVIVCDHFFMFQYIPKELNQRVIYHAHNAEHRIWFQRSKLERSIVKKLFLRFESWKVKQYERAIIANARVVMASPNDIQRFQEFKISKNVTYKPTLHLGNYNLLEAPDLQFELCQNHILFLGSLDWFPNFDALKWFIDEVWPLVTPFCDMKILAVGANNHAYSKHFPQEAFVLVDYVDDLETIFSQSRFMILPIRIGSGMNVKLMDCLYRGLPFVATPNAIEGYNDEIRNCGMVTQNKIEFSNAVLRLFMEQHLVESMATQGRVYATKHLTTESERNRWIDAINEILH